jgi:hypothetical protein
VRRAALVVSGVLLAGCGSRPGSAPAPLVVTVACRSGTAAVEVGGQLRVAGCAAGTTVAPTSSALRTVGEYDLLALRPATTTVALTGAPSCKAGTLCPQFRVDIGTIRVAIR